MIFMPTRIQIKYHGTSLNKADVVLVIPVVFGFMRWMPVINANIII